MLLNLRDFGFIALIALIAEVFGNCSAVVVSLI
jgi:hypothetical protein